MMHLGAGSVQTSRSESEKAVGHTGDRDCSKRRGLPGRSMEEKYCLQGSRNHKVVWWSRSVMGQEMVRGYSSKRFEFASYPTLPVYPIVLPLNTRSSSDYYVSLCLGTACLRGMFGHGHVSVAEAQGWDRNSRKCSWRGMEAKLGRSCSVLLWSMEDSKNGFYIQEGQKNVFGSGKMALMAIRK